MEKIEIVKRFLELKVQITPNALDKIFLNQEVIPKLEELVKKENVFILDETLVDKILTQRKSKIEIFIPKPKGTFTVEDVLNYLKGRFEILSSILQKNNQLKNLVSISRAEKIKGSETFSLIGMVKDKTTYSITLEDFSGSTNILLERVETEKLFIDDVIGLEVSKEEGKLKGKKIYFPSLSFFRKISGKKINVKENGLVEIDGETIELPKTEIVKIFFNDSFIILIDKSIIEPYQLKDKTIMETLISLIERRHLNPSFFISKKLYEEDPFLLKNIPDAIIVKNANTFERKIYKGIELITLL
ncbi:MAG: hypothetical protein ACP5F8_00415 [Candidatus Aenigmatarchaeota archaeon]